MTEKRVGDFEIADLYDLLEEQFEKFRCEHDDFKYWKEDDIVYTAEEYREELFGNLQPGQEIIVTGYFGSNEHVVIPDGATSMAERLFSGNTAMKSVRLPGSLKKINCYVFKNCTALTSVDIPDSVTEIDYGAFLNCTALERVQLGNNLSSVGIKAFSGCTSLKSVIIPDSVSDISDNAFDGCSSLSEVRLGSGLKRICTGAFAGCSLLREINLPESVTKVDLNAFYRSGLEEIYLPKNVDDTGHHPLSSRNNLKKVVIDPENPYLVCKGNCIIRVSNGMLLTTVGKFELPNDGSIKKIWHWVFCENPDLTEIDIPEGVTHLYHSVFSGCKNLRRVNLPDTLEIIGQEDFAHCTALEEIVIPGNVKEVETRAFESCGIKRLIVKRGVKILGFNAFNNCKSLEEAYIPSTVHKIDCGLFDGYLFGGSNENLCVYIEKWDNDAHKHLSNFVGKFKVVFVDKNEICDK